MILCTAIIGGAVGAIVGAIGYTACTFAAGREFNTGHMLIAAGGGAAAGALIGTGTGLHVHHLVEQRFAPALGQAAAQAQQWLSAGVTPEEHQIFTNNWRSAIGYSNQAMEWTTKNATPEKIWQTAQDIYKNAPALLDAARKTMFGE